MFEILSIESTMRGENLSCCLSRDEVLPDTVGDHLQRSSEDPG